MRFNPFSAITLIITDLFISPNLAAFWKSQDAAYLPASHIAINCGSSGASPSVDGQEWFGDGDFSRPNFVQHAKLIGKSTCSNAILSKFDSVSDVPFLYRTVRISSSQFVYVFHVFPGQKLIRLHFNPVRYRGFDRSNDFFTVEANQFSFLSNFSAFTAAETQGKRFLVKEFLMNVQENLLNITFFPSSRSKIDNTYAFVNGIEIIPVPTGLYYTHDNDPGAQVLGQKYRTYIDNSTALEVVEQINVQRRSYSLVDYPGMFRRWQMIPNKQEKEFKNFTWNVSLDSGFGYLVRLHFCELKLTTAGRGEMGLRLLINNVVVNINVNALKVRGNNGIGVYSDYIVMVKGHKQKGAFNLVIFLQSKDELIDGPLKGFEILKLSNYENSLATPNAVPPGSVLPHGTLKRLLSVFGFEKVIAIGVLVILALVNAIVYKLRQVWEANFTEGINRPSALKEPLFRRFSLSEIKSATRNFDGAFIIGKGGFGIVYKGLIDKGQMSVAIKRLKPNSKQGSHEFWTEIETLYKLRHVHLVSLIGYCDDYHEMILVYEYMSCGTLADRLYKLCGEGNSYSALSWNQRLRICIGAGRGLDYLHTGHGVIHRDVKSSNILLDEDYAAKVSDLGLAKLEKKGQLKSHISTNVKGTPGYLDPDYYRTRKLTRKSDIYAFGVVLLEVLTGRRAVDTSASEDQRSLTMWAKVCISKGEVEKLVDPSIRGEISPNSIKFFVELVETCLQDVPKERPTMAQVVIQLEWALLQQENTGSSALRQIINADEVQPSSDETVQSVNSAPQTNLSVDEQKIGMHNEERAMSRMLPVIGTQVNRTKISRRKLSWQWPWDALWKRSRRSRELNFLISGNCDMEVKLQVYDLATITAATDGFSSIIARTSLGTVYKGVLSTGEEIAVKKLGYDYPRFSEEFRNEALKLCKLEHENIIKLYGCCFQGDERMLIYEFPENDSLDKFTYGYHELGWKLRFRIILGIARGVLYLHKDSGFRICHGNLCPTNILLDTRMNPKISGFSLARISEEDQTETIKINRTFDYMAPEYIPFGLLSLKSDIFSLGVIILQIVSCQIEPRSFFYRAWKLWDEGRALEFFYKATGDEFSVDEVVKCIQVGLLCSQPEANDRPTISSVLQMLEGDDVPLAQPKDPELYTQILRSYTQASQNDIEISNDITTTQFEGR